VLDLNPVSGLKFPSDIPVVGLLSEMLVLDEAVSINTYSLYLLRVLWIVDIQPIQLNHARAFNLEFVVITILGL